MVDAVFRLIQASGVHGAQEVVGGGTRERAVHAGARLLTELPRSGAVGGVCVGAAGGPAVVPRVVGAVGVADAYPVCACGVLHAATVRGIEAVVRANVMRTVLVGARHWLAFPGK